MENIDEKKDDFEALLDEYMQEVEKGQVTKGIIVAKDDEYGYLHIGGKSEGKVNANEISEFELGDEIEVLITSKEDKEGYTRVSRRAYELNQNWDKVNAAFENQEIISAKIEKKVNGGYIVEVLKYMSFMPNSLSSIREEEGLAMIGETIKIIIKDVKDGKRKKILVSRKEVRIKEELEFLKGISEGQIVDAEIKDVLGFGLSVKVGAVIGFIHISEVAWKKVDNLELLYKVGEKIQAKVLTIDNDKRSLKLSVKQLKNDPWIKAGDKYTIGNIIDGKVVRTTKFGAFVELEEGIEGLIHITDFSWSKKLKTVEEYLQVGDLVKVQVIELDVNSRKLKLGIKQLSQNPWDEATKNYAVENIVKGKVVEVKDFGIFVEVEEGIDVFVHVSDLSWVRNSEVKYVIGDEVEVKILELDVESKKIKAGIKQLAKSPWEKVIEKYTVGDVVKRKITSITAFGLFVEVEEGIDGMIHISQASKDYIKKLEDRFSQGDEVEAEIIEIDIENKKIKLSIKKIELEDEKEENEDLIKKYGTTE